MDTRTKILSLETARSLRVPRLVMVTGYFDLPRAAHVRELEAIRQRRGAGTLMAVVLPWEDAFLSQRARAEMAAALRVIDYVVAIDNGDLEALVGALGPTEVARLEASDARRNRELIEHVHRRHSS
jgi:bifunctional ADP-heptose synthase (sugar kinase/adenylyltransferase)